MRSSVQNTLVDGIEPVDRTLPGIPGWNALCGRGKTLSQRSVEHQFPHAAVETFFVALSNDESIDSILNEFRDAAGLECDHGSARGEGLEKNQAEGLLKHGGQDEDVGRRVVRIDFTGRDQAENEGALACHGLRKSVAYLLFRGLQRLPLQPSFFNPQAAAAGNGEARVGILFGQLGKSPGQIIDPLFRSDRSGKQEQDIRILQAKLLPYALPFSFALVPQEHFRLYSSRNSDDVRRQGVRSCLA